MNSSDDGKEVRIGQKHPQNGRFRSCLARPGTGAAMVRKTLQKIAECNLENRLERHNIFDRPDARLRKIPSLGCALLRESGKSEAMRNGNDMNSDFAKLHITWFI